MMEESLDLIATLSKEEDLMETVLLFLGVSSLISIELTSKIFRSHMEKTLTWKKKLKHVFPEYFSNKLSVSVKERLSRFTAKPDSHEKFKGILLCLFKLNGNWKNGHHNVKKVNISALTPFFNVQYQWGQSVLDSKCVLKSGTREQRAWFTEDLHHPYPRKKSDKKHEVKTVNGTKECYCLEEKLEFDEAKLVSITSEHIYIWKLEELKIFQKSNFEYLKSLNVPINENTFLPVRLNATGKYFQFVFIWDNTQIFIDLFERPNDEVPNDLGPRIFRCRIGEEASFELSHQVLDMLSNSGFDENHIISVVKSPNRVCVWNFSPKSQEQTAENHEANEIQLNFPNIDYNPIEEGDEIDQDDDLDFESDPSDQSDDDLDEEPEEVVEYDGIASLIWSLERDENVFPRPTYTSLAIRYPLAYVGKSNSRCEVWNVEENLRLSILYLGEATDGTVMSVRQVFPVGNVILTTSSAGWLSAFDKQVAEEISEAYIEPLWKKTNSGNGRKYAQIYADETKVVSVQIKGKYALRSQIYIVVQDFWGKIEKKPKDKVNDEDLGEGCSTSAVKLDEIKDKAKRKKLTKGYKVPVIESDNEDTDNDNTNMDKVKDNGKKRKSTFKDVSVIQIDDDDSTLDQVKDKGKKRKQTHRDIPVIQIDEEDIDDDIDDYNYAEEEEYIY